MSKFNMRAFASLLLSFSFPVVLATGLVLWLAHSPQTFGIGKGIWKHAHIWASLLMAATAILHFVLNWSVYWSYLRRRDCPNFHVSENGTVPFDAGTTPFDTKIETGPWRRAPGRLNQKWELALALAIALAVVGTAALYPSDDMMQRFAAMNLPQIAQMSGQSVDEVVAILKKEGIAVHDPADSLREIAEHNKVSPQVVISIVQPKPRGPAARPGPR